MILNIGTVGRNRVMIRIQGGKATIEKFGAHCPTVCKKSTRAAYGVGSTYHGWNSGERFPISLELAKRWLASRYGRKALQSRAAWGAWEEAVEAAGIGSGLGSAAFTSVKEK